METKFDHIGDDAIEVAVGMVDASERYPDRESDLRKIAHLAWWMSYWKSWLGPPVTYFEERGRHYDGHHRTRAVKFLARRRKIQIHIPVRYSPEMK